MPMVKNLSFLAVPRGDKSLHPACAASSGLDFFFLFNSTGDVEGDSSGTADSCRGCRLF